MTEPSFADPLPFLLGDRRDDQGPVRIRSRAYLHYPPFPFADERLGKVHLGL
jgi:hypothetical protein